MDASGLALSRADMLALHRDFASRPRGVSRMPPLERLDRSGRARAKGPGAGRKVRNKVNATAGEDGPLARTLQRWLRATTRANSTSSAEEHCTWFKLQGGINLALRFQGRGMGNKERCEYRYDTLNSAKAACESAHAWCGGVARDTGLDCERGRLQFELRLNSSVGSASGAASWLYWCTAGALPSAPPRVPTYKAPPLVVPRWDVPERPAACAGRCPRLRDLFVGVMTSAKYHDTRCPLIKQTYATALPAGHLAFYSNAADATLPAIRVDETSFPGAQSAGGNPYLRAQLRWPEALRRALDASRAVQARWTMIVDDDTFVVPPNVLRVLRGYDPAGRVLIGQACVIAGVPRMCGGAGWVMSTPLHQALVGVLPRCRAKSGCACARPAAAAAVARH
eukprot:3964258-Prymnesium_polylepis.1